MANVGARLVHHVTRPCGTKHSGDTSARWGAVSCADCWNTHEQPPITWVVIDWREHTDDDSLGAVVATFYVDPEVAVSFAIYGSCLGYTVHKFSF